MTPELWALAATVLIQSAAVIWSQRSLNADVGMEANASPRDEELALSTRTKRLRRALGNHVENFPMFIAAVAITELSGGGTWFTALCAWIFVLARALYLPAYAFGWVPWRSLIFAAGWLATLALMAGGILA